VREVREEVDLDVDLYHKGSILIQEDGYKKSIPPQFMNRHKINETHEHVTLVYFAKARSGKLVLSKTEKNEDYKWFMKEDLDNPEYEISDHIKIYARTALEKLSS